MSRNTPKTNTPGPKNNPGQKNNGNNNGKGKGDSENDLENDAIFEAGGLQLGYAGRAILSNVNLRISRGDFWFLIGPNGQGKTTLISGILGRLRPMAGGIARRGDFARPDRIGFVPQQCSTNPTLPTTVREFVRLGLVGIHAKPPEQTERLRWALGIVGLEGLESHDFWSLSGGQRQRALVARALIRRPHLLIADEPTSGLDLSVETALYESIAELNRKERLTVILVTHDLAVAARYATHLALLHDGRVEAGATHDILLPGKLARAYGVPIEVSSEMSGSVSVRLG
jgi:zinc transport system ATP-binding protein